ncbi:hypothetical protein COT63_01315 [Candidatus Shapirobacteria bacterium CG09_land_8_20_14_0_10_38_17]|uniref:Transposase IS200-like domain-containing protein n=1 Tax=Candidatus Shapirobacteria bacterium CG09_land_8_20_14_0_10_38_17 TaxID=1974884 RepID=A0A2H0WRA3_9BACT|nr:MAG: hypothetical protein COT63_01315 [Candidatus Shapirobacteria bacterium CG09_land_8_20_14_0_10_38_17]
MPSKNSIKDYRKNSYYHIYNRGVNKGSIFLDKQDYSVFLFYLKEYLTERDEENLHLRLVDHNLSYRERERINKLLALNNFSDEISLLSYCLMPNHFHFLLKQGSSESIALFMNSFATRYTMYFNRKYKRIGPLYQGVYKAVLVNSDEQLLYLSLYIHRQALASQGVTSGDWKIKQPCSFLEYLGKRKTKWIKTNDILAYFPGKDLYGSYKKFVMGEPNLELISKIMID